LLTRTHALLSLLTIFLEYYFMFTIGADRKSTLGGGRKHTFAHPKHVLGAMALLAPWDRRLCMHSNLP